MLILSRSYIHAMAKWNSLMQLSVGIEDSCHAILFNFKYRHLQSQSAFTASLFDLIFRQAYLTQITFYLFNVFGGWGLLKWLFGKKFSCIKHRLIILIDQKISQLIEWSLARSPNSWCSQLIPDIVWYNFKMFKYLRWEWRKEKEGKKIWR